MFSNDKKRNSAIVMLVARINLIETTLYYFFKNWNIKYQYPIYIHTFGDIISSSLKKRINERISKNIFFIKIYPEVPSHIKEHELYYNRTYLKYVKETFPKKRVGFLHMCNFLTNINSYGKKGCIDNKLRKYDNLMFVDDDIYFKKKIEIDLFDYLKKYPSVTAFSNKLSRTQVTKDVTENLWNFYKNLIKKKKIFPKNNHLKKSLNNQNDKVFYNLNWSCGCFSLFNMRKLEEKKFRNYIKEFNKYGGAYKHRWNNGYVIDLFLRTFFKKPFYDLDLVKKGFIETKIKGAEEFIYWGHKDAYNSFIFRLIIKLKKLFS